EIPVKWYRSICRWQAWNRPKKTTLSGTEIPDSNDEYLIYQTLVGSWPLGNLTGKPDRNYIDRIKEYMTKAVNEAKLVTSWMNPDETYTKGVCDFIEQILSAENDNRFLNDFLDLQKLIQKPG